MLQENSDEEMEAATANAGFHNVPTMPDQTPVDEAIIIDDNPPDDDAIVD